MQNQFADIVANLSEMTASFAVQRGQDIIELSDFEITSIGGGEAITNEAVQ